MPKRPIEPGDYQYGVKVVDIGDLRVARGQTRVPKSTCSHQHLVYDEAERRVYCEDCESDVDSFDAFLHLVSQYDKAWKAIERKNTAAAEALRSSLRSRAAKAMDDQWRKRTTAPACPHCGEGLLPEDITGQRLNTVSVEITRRKRARQKKQEGNHD